MSARFEAVSCAIFARWQKSRAEGMTRGSLLSESLVSSGPDSAERTADGQAKEERERVRSSNDGSGCFERQEERIYMSITVRCLEM